MKQLLILSFAILAAMGAHAQKADIFQDIPEERILQAIEAHCD